MHLVVLRIYLLLALCSGITTPSSAQVTLSGVGHQTCCCTHSGFFSVQFLWWWPHSSLLSNNLVLLALRFHGLAEFLSLSNVLPAVVLGTLHELQSSFLSFLFCVQRWGCWGHTQGCSGLSPGGCLRIICGSAEVAIWGASHQTWVRHMQGKFLPAVLSPDPPWGADPSIFPPQSPQVPLQKGLAHSRLALETCLLIFSPVAAASLHPLAGAF